MLHIDGACRGLRSLRQVPGQAHQHDDHSVESAHAPLGSSGILSIGGVAAIVCHNEEAALPALFASDPSLGVQDYPESIERHRAVIIERERKSNK